MSLEPSYRVSIGATRRAVHGPVAARRAPVPAPSGSIRDLFGEPAVSERIQKVLARAGIGSRRAVERWIEARQVRVNGRVAEPGAAVERDDRVQVRGRRYRVVAAPARAPRWLRYHKPEGELTTRHDPEGRPTVFDRLPAMREGGGRWVALGRLDVNTAGLMLFTDDGALAHALVHPSAEVEREYAVRVRGPVDAETLRRLSAGIALDDGEARFDRIRDAGGEGANHWYHVVIREGRRNEVRRMWEAVGCQVARLIRVRFGPVTLPRRLWAGHFEDLTAAERQALEALAGRSGDGGLALEPLTGRRGGPPTARRRRRPAERRRR